MVEFALLAIPFIVLVLGIIQYGFYFWNAETTNSAAREAARRVVVGDCWDSTKLLAYASDQAPLTSSATWNSTPVGKSVGDPITITVVSNADFLGFIPLPNDGTITRSYDARMETDEASDPLADLCSGY